MSLIYISDTNIWIDFRNAGLLEHMFRLPFTLCWGSCAAVPGELCRLREL